MDEPYPPNDAIASAGHATAIAEETIVRTQIDRRAAERVPLEIPVNYTMGLPSETIRATTTSNNLSAGGVSFYIPRMVSPQIVCQVTITLPDHPQPLSFLGRVAWCSKGSAKDRHQYDVGIAFSPPGTEEDDVTFDTLHHFIASYLVTQYL